MEKLLIYNGGKIYTLYRSVVLHNID